MRALLKLLLITIILSTGWMGEIQAQKSKDNKLSKAEKKEGWILMFNGKNTKNWRGWQKPDPPGVWSALDGTLFCKALENDEAEPGQKGYIIYDGQLSNFQVKGFW